eukprot:CAMPEP_0116962536 /NCGR_PEP_ID=MMETSP0467-20121206/47327_1 /TAXON_ID=283647 /ORGANISM="Mesodinium pulex, Strain SPMC105" /LENGTH=32 /DNA_ID= /DNA_START= /DNA_END= /DNA_ORIENTATION=
MGRAKAETADMAAGWEHRRGPTRRASFSSLGA